MKKFIKNKRKTFLAVLSIAIIASMILVGTYAWIVQRAGGKDDATLTVASFSLRVNPKDSVRGHIDWDHGTTKNPYAFKECAHDVCDPCVAHDFTDSRLFYPGDAEKFKYDISLEHNREVLLKIEFVGANLERQLNLVRDEYVKGTGDGNPDEYWRRDAIKNSIYNPVNALRYATYDAEANSRPFLSIEGQLTAEFSFVDNQRPVPIANNQIIKIGDAYYVFVKYNDRPAGNVGSAEILFGIKGCPFNQNYWETQPITIKAAPKVTAVQATDRAIMDVFPEFANPCSRASRWLWELRANIHDTVYEGCDDCDICPVCFGCKDMNSPCKDKDCCPDDGPVCGCEKCVCGGTVTPPVVDNCDDCCKQCKLPDIDNLFQLSDDGKYKLSCSCDGCVCCSYVLVKYTVGGNMPALLNRQNSGYLMEPMETARIFDLSIDENVYHKHLEVFDVEAKPSVFYYVYEHGDDGESILSNAVDYDGNIMVFTLTIDKKNIELIVHIVCTCDSDHSEDTPWWENQP